MLENTVSSTSDAICATAPGGVINSVAYERGQRVAWIPIGQLDRALANPDWFLWVGLYEPSEELLKQVQSAFKLHDLAVEDAHRAHQRTKLEVYDDSLFVVLRTVRRADDGEGLEFGETHAFVGRQYIVTVRHGSLRSHVGMRTQCEAAPQQLAKGSAFVLHALMDFIVDQYVPVIQAIEEELNALESHIFSGSGQRDVAVRIYRLHRDLIALKRAVAPLIDVSSDLMRFEGSTFTPETRPYFQNVNDHALRIAHNIDDVQELSNTALHAHLALISLSQNDDTKRLAAWAAIVSVPTMIAGFYGMNFSHMPELAWRFGYPAVVGVTAAVCFMLYRGFKRSGWL